MRGYEVYKNSAYTIRMERATDLRTIENEPKIFRIGTTKYTLNNNYVNSIKKVVAIVQATQNITRGSIVGGIDYLPLSPTVEIISITQGTTTFVKGTDFQLLNDGVDWSLGNNAPAPGSSYTCVWTYNKTMMKDVDYNLSHSDDWYTGYVNFLSGDKPVDGTSFLVNYDFMLCRRDVIGLDKDGNVLVIKGQSDVIRTVAEPSVDSDHMLTLGSVLLTPKSDTVSIINNNTKTITMLDLYNMLERINDIEYNQAITDLDQEAAAGESATELKGIYTDGFIGFTKADTTHESWSAALDLDAQELTIPYIPTVSTLVIDANSQNRVGKFGRLITNPYTEITLLSQPLASDSIRINSYNAFPKSPVLSLDPRVDNWVENQDITVQGATVTKTSYLYRFWHTAHKNDWYGTTSYLWDQAGIDYRTYVNYGTNRTNDQNAILKTNSVQKSTTTSIVTNAIMYMRQRVINVEIQNLEPSSDNIVVVFNGVQVALTPKTVAYRSETTGALKADANGKAYGYFTVPSKTLCGTVEVRAYPTNTPSLVGVANYTANGNKVTTTKTVWTEKTVYRISDPLAQSFQFDQDQFVTGVGLYFKDKNLTEPITVQLRNMVNGYPGTTLYAEAVVLPADVKVSTNATQETKITFDNPAYCNANEQYCFTILSNSDLDSVWMAETTKTDIASNTQISKNPYINGVMFSSSNALTWTAHQSQDLKFNLYGAKFDTTTQISFEPFNNVSFNRILIMSDESIPVGCTISWQYSINNEDWLPIEAYDDRELTETAESVQFRCTLVGTSTTSPTIASDSLTFCGFTNESSGVYISRNVSVPQGFNTVKVVADMSLPAGSNAVVSFATDTNGNEWQALSNTETVQKSTTFKTYTFTKTLTEKAYNYRVKIELSTVNKVNRPIVQNLKSIMKTV